jgi:hypothetical protein
LEYINTVVITHEAIFSDNVDLGGQVLKQFSKLVLSETDSLEIVNLTPNKGDLSPIGANVETRLVHRRREV